MHYITIHSSSSSDILARIYNRVERHRHTSKTHTYRLHMHIAHINTHTHTHTHTHNKLGGVWAIGFTLITAMQDVGVLEPIRGERALHGIAQHNYKLQRLYQHPIHRHTQFINILHKYWQFLIKAIHVIFNLWKERNNKKITWSMDKLMTWKRSECKERQRDMAIKNLWLIV